MIHTVLAQDTTSGARLALRYRYSSIKYLGAASVLRAFELDVQLWYNCILDYAVG